MSNKTNIFFTGVTGYVGGSVLKYFLVHPDVQSFDLTALVRSPEKADKLKALGVNAVIGSLQDLDVLEGLASKADFVFSLADSDDLDATKAILRGSKKYFDAKSIKASVIHTSGTGTFIDNTATGENTPVTIYDDMNIEQIESLPETKYHRNVDTELAKADQAGYVKTYIIMPASVYGLATGILVDQGIQNPYSLTIPALIKAALARGRGGIIGRGQNIWDHVHIEDLADLYLIVFNSIRSNPDAISHGREGLFIAENGENTHYQVGKAIAETLVDLGKGTNPEPSTFTDEEIQLYFKYYGTLFGSTSRARGIRSKSIGWKPTRTTADLLASVRPETESLLEAA